MFWSYTSASKKQVNFTAAGQLVYKLKHFEWRNFWYFEQSEENGIVNETLFFMNKMVPISKCGSSNVIRVLRQSR